MTAPKPRFREVTIDTIKLVKPVMVETIRFLTKDTIFEKKVSMETGTFSKPPMMEDATFVMAWNFTSGSDDIL